MIYGAYPSSSGLESNGYRLQHHQGSGDTSSFILAGLHRVKPWPLLLCRFAADTTLALVVQTLPRPQDRMMIVQHIAVWIQAAHLHQGGFRAHLQKGIKLQVLQSSGCWRPQGPHDRGEQKISSEFKTFRVTRKFILSEKKTPELVLLS